MMLPHVEGAEFVLLQWKRFYVSVDLPDVSYFNNLFLLWANLSLSNLIVSIE